MKGLRERLSWLARDATYIWAPRLASRIRRRWILMRHTHANVRIHPSCYLGPGFSLHIETDGTFEAGPHCEFRRGFRAEVVGRGRITFGEACVCTYYVLMQCSTLIEIGDRVMFGQSAMVVDGNHRFRDLSKPMLAQGYDYREVHIEDDVTTTTKNTIIANIGTRSFVGANAVVTRDLPPYCVCLGSPAKPVEYFGPPGLEPPELAAQAN